MRLAVLVAFFAALPLFVVTAVPCTGGDAPAFAPAVAGKIEAAVRRELAAYGGATPVPGAVVGIWYPGHGTFVKGIGYADLATHRPMALDDRFRIGSNTKTFVNTVLLQLVDEGKLGLDDPVSRFRLPVTVPNSDRINVRELMEMRSGIIDLYASPAFQKLDIAPTGRFDLVHWVQLALDHPPLFAPGTKYNYSNTNYMLLGWIVEAVTHDTVANEILTRLIVPLGLRATSFPETDPTMPAPFTHGYGLDTTQHWIDQTVVLPPRVSWAAGVMISDMADMKKWVKAYVTGTTNSAATQRARLRCVPTGVPDQAFGLGIGCSAGWYGYTGGITGYNTSAYYLPSQEATVIAFVNSQRQPKGKPDVSSAIFRDIAAIVFPRNVPSL